MLRVVLPSSVLEKLQFKLTQAGDPISLTSLLVIWACSTAILPGMFFMVNVANGAQLDTRKLGVLLVLFAGGLYLPLMWLRAKIRNRQNKVLKARVEELRGDRARRRRTRD